MKELGGGSETQKTHRLLLFGFISLLLILLVGCTTTRNAAETSQADYFSRIKKNSSEFDVSDIYTLPPLTKNFNGAGWGDLGGELTVNLSIAKNKKTQLITKHIMIFTAYERPSWHMFKSVSFVGGKTIAPKTAVTRNVSICSPRPPSYCDYKESFTILLDSDVQSESLAKLRLDSADGDNWGFGFPETYLKAFNQLASSLETPEIKEQKKK